MNACAQRTINPANDNNAYNLHLVLLPSHLEYTLSPSDSKCPISLSAPPLGKTMVLEAGHCSAVAYLAGCHRLRYPCWPQRNFLPPGTGAAPFPLLPGCRGGRKPGTSAQQFYECSPVLPGGASGLRSAAGRLEPETADFCWRWALRSAEPRHRMFPVPLFSGASRS